MKRSAKIFGLLAAGLGAVLGYLAAGGKPFSTLLAREGPSGSVRTTDQTRPPGSVLLQGAESASSGSG